MNSQENITIAIVLYKENYELISKTLEKITSFKIIIVDNANNRKLKEKIQKNFFIFKYILNKKNVGFSAGYNQAIKLSETKFSLILGPDCIITENDILKLHSALENNEDCFLTSPIAFNNDNILVSAGGLLPKPNEKETILQISGDTCVDATLGACMFLRTKDFLEIGLFDEFFFLYFSDFDLCRRIRKYKMNIISVYDAKCIHHHGNIKITNKFIKQFIRDYNYTFDQFYYFYKSNEISEILKSFEKKKKSYLFKFIIKILTFNFIDAISIFSRLLGFYKFKSQVKKRRDGRVV